MAKYIIIMDGISAYDACDPVEGIPNPFRCLNGFADDNEGYVCSCIDE